MDYRLSAHRVITLNNFFTLEVRMSTVDSSNFFKVLKCSKKSYSWTLDGENNIVAQIGNNVYNPIAAVASFVGASTKGYSSNKRDTLRLAKSIGLDQNFAEKVYDAAKCLTNRGQTQIVRGRMRNALGL